jgi:hypothetical protein
VDAEDVAASLLYRVRTVDAEVVNRDGREYLFEPWKERTPIWGFSE